MKYAIPQPMSTFALIETSKRLLSTDCVRILADHGGPPNIVCSTRQDGRGVEAIEFDSKGRAERGRWNPDTEAFTPDE